MPRRFLTDFARRFDAEVVGRRPLLLAVAAAVVSSSRTDDSLARSAMKKCAKKGGAWLTTADRASPCHCAGTCSSTNRFQQCRTKGCVCFATTEGTGFCGSSVATNGCASSADCSGGAACIIAPDQFGCSGQNCTNKADCQPHGAGYACINGVCQGTECANPCR